MTAGLHVDLPPDLADQIEFIWTPFSGFQTRTMAATEFEVLVGGSKGPGKSDLVLIKAIAQCDKARHKAYITRETGPQLDELKARSHRHFSRLPEKPAWNGDGHGRWNWPTGATVIFEAVGTLAECIRIQGKEPTFIGQDEVGNIADERVVDTLQAELRSPDKTIRRQWMGTANPGKPGHHWCKRRFVDPCGRDGKRVIVRRVRLRDGRVANLTRRYIPGTVLDNPIYANDPLYMAQLWTLPEVLRLQLLFGDWDAGVGAAIPELDERVHFVRPFRVPDYWHRFGGFDYGFAHWWVLCHITTDEEGNLWVIDTVRGRRQQPPLIVERIKSRVQIHHPNYLYTDTDTYPWQKRRERSDNTPSLEEDFRELDFILRHGNVDRKKGLANLRYYLAWKGLGPGGTDILPALRLFDTPGNHWLFDQLQSMVTDEADIEDVLKVHADPETGNGGDDGYDALRVGVASRPQRSIGQFFEGNVTAFSKQTLAHMVEHLYRDGPLPNILGRRGPGGISYTQLGG